MRAISLLLSVVVLALVACRGAAGSVPPAQGVTRPATSAAATATPAPTAQPIPTSTGVVPAPIATASQATPTPDGTRFLTEILLSNGDCRLPCWWGMVPGKTDWGAAEAFLKPFSLQVAPYELDEYTYYTALLLAPEQVSERPVADDFAVWNDTVQLISALGKTGSAFTPAAVLKQYGIPDEVWLQTANAPREGYLGFITALVYQEQGFLIRYGSQGTVDEADITSCIPNRGGSLRLVAWDPALDLSYIEAMAIGMSTSIATDDIALEPATGMSLQEFYDAFSNAETDVCLRTPRALWPNP